MNYFTACFRAGRGEHLPLNGIRTIAIFMLFYVHLFRAYWRADGDSDVNSYLVNFIENGSQSIDMFFVLSGFLISGPLMRELAKTETVDLRGFFTKRSLRIFPPYFAFLALQFFVFIPALAKFVPADQQHEILALRGRVLFDALYVSNYFPGTMFHGWSLSLEEQFYVFFPFFLLLVFRWVPVKRQLLLLVGMFLLPIAYRLFVFHAYLLPASPDVARGLYNKLIYYPFQGHIGSIFVGIIAAWIYDNKREWLEKVYNTAWLQRAIHGGAWAVIVAYSVFVYEFDVSIPSMVIRFPIFALAWGVVMLMCMRPGSVLGRILSWPVFTPFAKLSYSAYIIHVVVMTLMMGPIFRGRPISEEHVLFWFAPLALVTFVVAYFYHLAVERPFALMRDALTAKWKREQAALAAVPVGMPAPAKTQRP